MTFLLNINSTPSPPISGWVTVSPLLRFLFKEDIGSYKSKLAGVLATRILLFINNRGEFTNISNPYCDGLCIILIPPP
jgi:hypothetical protein